MLCNRLRSLNFNGTGKKRGRPSKSEEIKSKTLDPNICNKSTDKITASTPPLNSSTVTQPTIIKSNPMIPSSTPQFIEVFVNDKPVQIPVGSVIIQACSAAGIDIPRFCYHERLAIAGNCRMCLVQVEKMPKLIASCSQPVAPGMRIQTESAQVKKAREGVMEFLLANHPLDCAICDQGGECDLQDQSMAFGSDRSRFNLETEHKRAVENKDFGPLIKTSMNRCIHCTRCVRFGNEIAGLSELGTTGRGNDMQIGTYVQSMLGSELSANIIDLCPVGALTSKPYEFAARPWELRKTESIDVMDAVGSAIRIDTRGVELMRIQPRTNDKINEEWLSDKSRFISDGLKTQRLTKPSFSGKEVNWGTALSAAAEIIKESGDKVAVVAGPFADAETLISTRDLLGKENGENLFIAPTLYDNESIDEIENIKLPCDHISQFKSGLTLEQMESIDTLLLIGCNMRHEAPLLNARIRKAFLKRENFSAGVIGCSPDDDLNFDFDWLGGDLNSLKNIKTSPFWETLCKSDNAAIFVSNALISEHPEGSKILDAVMKLSKDLMEENPKFINERWNGLCWIPRSSSHVASRLFGYSRIATKSSLSKFKSLLLIGSPDTIRYETQKLIYIGHHADRLAPLSEVILPCASYTEKSGTFINLEGRIQRTQPAMSPPDESRSDWSIIRALSEFINPNRPLPYDNLEELREMRMKEISPQFSNVNNSILPCDSGEAKLILSNYKSPSNAQSQKSSSNEQSQNSSHSIPFKTVNIPDFYLTDVISRSSATMAKCSLAFTSKIAGSTLEIDEKYEEIMKQ